MLVKYHKIHADAKFSMLYTCILSEKLCQDKHTYMHVYMYCIHPAYRKLRFGSKNKEKKNEKKYKK